MRIAHLLVTRGWGGAELLAMSLAKRAREAGHEVVVDAAPLAREGVAEYGFLCSGNESGVVPWAVAAHRRLRQFEPDIVHAHLSTPAYSGALLLSVGRHPTVVTLHLLPELRWPHDSLLRVSSGFTLGLATRKPFRIRLVTVGSHDGALIARRFGEHTVQTIPNAPVPFTQSRNALSEPAFEGSDFRLLTVGRLERQKGIDRVIAALSEIPPKDRLFRLVVVGAGPELGALQAQTLRAGISHQVRFVGAKPARPMMRAAHLVLCASRYEGMPLVPMEAVLAGCPVVASAIAPHRELFEDIPGALLPDDPAEWSRTLLELMQSPARLAQLQQAQAANAASYSFERLWNEYAQLYAQFSTFS